MKIKLSEEVEEIIRNLLKKEQIATLVIEDHKIMRDGLETALMDAFPNTTVYCFEGFGVDEHPLEILIQKGKYDIIVTGGSLGTWEAHPVFERSSAKIVEFIKEHSPTSFVISTSLLNKTNQAAVDEGADFSVDKVYLSKFFNEVKALR